MLLKLVKILTLPVVLLGFIRDKRIIADNLESQRLPKALKWLDAPEEYHHWGLNGTLKHQSKVFLNAELPDDVRPGLVANAIRMVYDRELEISGNPVPWYKIYWCRFTWLINN